MLAPIRARQTEPRPVRPKPKGFRKQLRRLQYSLQAVPERVPLPVSRPEGWTEAERKRFVDGLIAGRSENARAWDEILEFVTALRDPLLKPPVMFAEAHQIKILDKVLAFVHERAKFDPSKKAE